MTNQPGFPGVPAAAAAAAAGAEGEANEEHRTDGGVPVGAADAEEDRRRASGDEGDDSGSDGSLVGDVMEDAGFGGSAAAGEDDGVPVGAADAEEDRRRASGEGGSD